MPKTLVRVLSLTTLLAAIFAAGLFAGRASAGATFAVTKPADTADGTCDSDCSLREATIAANVSGGTINVPAGTYPLTIPGTGENASLTGDLDITAAVTIVGAGPAATIIDGGNLDTVIDVRSTGNLVLSGVTVQHGKDPDTGGIFANGPLTLTNVHISNNKGEGTDQDGATGGVTVKHTATITDSLFSMNTATGYSTGGLYGTTGSSISVRNTTFDGNSATGNLATGGLGFNGDVVLEGVTVQNNTAHGHDPLAGLYASAAATIMNSQFLNNDAMEDGGVGAILNRGQMTIWDTTVDGNNTGTGGVGGILSLMNDANTSKLTLRRVVVSNNSALGDNATGGVWIETPADLGEVTIDHNSALDHSTGGIQFFEADPVQLSRVKISNNSATTNATGGLYVAGGSHLTVTDSWIDHNTTGGTAEAGVDVLGGSVADFIRVGITNNSASAENSTGGISFFEANGSLTNVTVSGNSAVGNATGGVYVETGTLTIDFTTIDNNTAGNSLGVGGLTNYGTLHISNSIVGRNPGGNNCWQTAGASTGHNIDQGTDCGFNQAADKQSANPQLGTLGFSAGGFSPTEPIGPNSPAFDAAGSCPLTEDQRIYPRPQGNGCDIGAFEYGAEYLTSSLKWGDLKCANGPGADDALVMIAQQAGVTVASPAGTACPALGAHVYVEGWFLQIQWGDYDCDGQLTIFDPLAVLRGAADIGYPSAKPCPKVGDAVQVSG